MRLHVCSLFLWLSLCFFFSFSLSFPLVCFFVRSFIMTLCCVMFGLFSSLFIFVLLILHWPSVVSFSFFLRSSFVYFLVGSGIILCFSLQHVIRTAIKSGWVRGVLLIKFMMVLGSLNRYARANHFHVRSLFFSGPSKKWLVTSQMENGSSNKWFVTSQMENGPSKKWFVTGQMDNGTPKKWSVINHIRIVHFGSLFPSKANMWTCERKK